MPALTPLRQLDGPTYARLLASGQLWTLYPEATGNYEDDTRPMNLRELTEAMHAARQTFAREDANKQVDRLYADHFHKAIMAEDFTDAEASVIDYEAYERGHSAGCEEIVGVAMELCEFAHKLAKAQ